MPSLQNFANELAAILPDVKRVALRFWGDWFGRPFDKGNLLVECQASDYSAALPKISTDSG
jgi:hypothetical protein